MGNLKERAGRGEQVLGTMISEISCPNLPRILKAAGFEFFVVDCEHGYFDFSQLAAMISVAKGAEIEALVRIPTIERVIITKVMVMGADGLLVPMVNTKEDAQKIVSFAKYPALGHRGASTQRVHTNYNPPKLEEYFPIANNRTMIWVQIETGEAMGNLEEIASVEGVDVIMVGPNDLSIDLGTPGDLFSPVMTEAMKTVAKTAGRAGKASGILTSNMEAIRSCRSWGMNVISCDSEVGMLMKMAKSVVKKLSESDSEQ